MMISRLSINILILYFTRTKGLFQNDGFRGLNTLTHLMIVDLILKNIMNCEITEKYADHLQILRHICWIILRYS